MAGELCSTPTEEFMKVIGRMILNMDKVISYLLIVAIMKVSMSTVNLKGLELIFILMEKSMMDNG